MNNHLYIHAGFKNQKTYLEKSFCGQPFKLANITEDKNEGSLRLMIMSSSPGILNNDKYSVEINIDENAEVHLTTQAYQRLFTMNNQASQCINIHLKNNAALSFLPHPNVPHKASDFSSVNNIYLSQNHSLLWSEIITCGRKLNGEKFVFTKFHNITNVYLKHKLVVRENILIEPLKRDVNAIGQLEGYTHQSTLLFINDTVEMKEISKQCQQLLAEKENISFGISMLPVNGLLFKILAQRAEQLFDCNKQLAHHILQSIKNVNEGNCFS